MKKFIGTILAAITLMTVPSCMKMLEERSTTILAGDIAYSSEGSLEADMNNIYLGLYNYANATINHLSFASALVHWKSTSRSGLAYEQGLRGTLLADQAQVTNALRDTYKYIYACNELLDALPSSPVDAKYKKEIEAEARFMRAFYYFYMVRMFGDVPIFRTAPKTEKDCCIPRNSFKEVYKFILEDLRFAEENMRTVADQRKINGEYSVRAQKYAATALKSNVYVQMASILETADYQAFGTLKTGEVRPDFSDCGITDAKTAWKLALDAADTVISEGGYDLEQDYRHLFRWDHDAHIEDFKSPERILVIQFTPNCGVSNSCSSYTLPPYFYGTSNYTENASMYSQINPNRLVFQKWAGQYGGELGTGSKNSNIYVSCPDPRFDATYIHTQWLQYRDAKGQPGEGGKPVTVTGYPDNGRVRGNNYDYFPHFRKYFSAQFKQDPGYAGFYIIRLAEMYLNAAEACASADITGKKGDAYAYVESLHSRARQSVDGSQPEYPKWTAGQWGGDKKALVNAIMWERVYELGAEGHEWFDTHRRGAEWLLENIYKPVDDFLNLAEQTEYKILWWYDRIDTGTGKNYSVPLTLNAARCAVLCEYPDYELNYNTALSHDDQNFFNQSKRNE